ncbi:hypothetical protein LAJ19_19835 (plasmid) [Deinococcus taeanensis]|uniref:hypothetical protein n=1 Tax=Deinococcus taeanensis TaxID=2737050 RepID=UPI001CDC9898|nr:hypothetical protein [Deinococcus taeanensis]UBV45387.1 hypothetical protein LAJ19_19835 [Deinococcus taeanensis]
MRRDSPMDEWSAQDWLGRLQTGSAGLLVEHVEVYGQPMNVVLTFTPDGDALIIASNTGAVTAIQAQYRHRFRVECLFRALKSKGFKLESTPMTLHDHVERLLCLLTLTDVWCVLVGIPEICPNKQHGRRAWSVVTLGLRALVRAISRKVDHEEVPLLRLIDLFMPSKTHS